MAYLALCASALALLAYTVRRTPASLPSLVPSALGMGSSLGLSDLIVCGLLRLYSYHPGLMGDAARENVAGAALADMLFVPITFGCLMVLFPRYRWVAAGGLILFQALTEAVFARYGLFVHHYWSVWISVLLFALRFGVAAWWLQHLERVGYTPGFRLLINGMAITYGWWLWAGLSSGLLRLWRMRLYLLANPQADRLLAAFLLHGTPFAVAGLYLLVRRWGDRPWLRWGFAAGGAIYLYGLRAAGIYVHRPGWSPVYDAAVLAALFWACRQFDRWLERHVHRSRPKARA